VLDEPTRARDALTLTLGLLSDWWRADPARPASGALLAAAHWQTLLRPQFAEVGVEGSEDRSVIVARLPAAPVVAAEPKVDLLPAVLRAVAEAIDADPAGIDPRARFADIGVDSLAAGDVARVLSDVLGRSIAPHVIDDQATPARLAAYLAAEAAPPSRHARPEPAVAVGP
jgi:acyl carrier protein